MYSTQGCRKCEGGEALSIPPPSPLRLPVFDLIKSKPITICPTTLLDLPPALTSMSLFVPLSESIFDPESKIEITKYRLYRGRV